MLPERLENGVNYLTSCGYDVVLGKHINKAWGYLAGRDADRLEDLTQFIVDPEIKAIFSSRGGYGTPRLLDRIDYDLFRKHPKILMGYSDLTALQLAIWHHTRLITFSGPMVAVEMADEIDAQTERAMWSILKGQNRDGSV